MTNFAPRSIAKPKHHYVSFDSLRPTQLAVGMRAIEAKKEKLQAILASPKRAKAYLERRPLPVVRGPGGDYYLIDKHHQSLALLQCGIETTRIDIIDDLSHMDRAAFWRTMEAEGRAYLFDESGTRARASQVPKTLFDLRADPYRDLAWRARESGYFKKVSVPFSEFRWAAFFRARIDIDIITADFGKALRMAKRLAASRAASSLPGYLH